MGRTQQMPQLTGSPKPELAHCRLGTFQPSSDLFERKMIAVPPQDDLPLILAQLVESGEDYLHLLGAWQRAAGRTILRAQQLSEHRRQGIVRQRDLAAHLPLGDEGIAAAN